MPSVNCPTPNNTHYRTFRSGSVFLILTVLQAAICQSSERVELGNAEPSQGGIPLSQPSNSGYQPDGSMDFSFAKSAEEKREFVESAGKVQAGTSFLEHMFECAESDDFSFSLPVEQQIAFYMYSYVQQGSSFVRIKDVRRESPVSVSIYELAGDESVHSRSSVDHSKLIIKTAFYYQKYIVFNGKAGKNYLMRFQTSGSNKLVALSMKVFVENADIASALSKDDASQYSRTTSRVRKELGIAFSGFGRYWMLDDSYLRIQMQKIKKYYRFEILEMVLVGIVGYAQLRLLLKLLKPNSIV